jgi:hypothetical protein
MKGAHELFGGRQNGHSSTLEIPMSRREVQGCGYCFESACFSLITTRSVIAARSVDAVEALQLPCGARSRVHSA